MKNLFIFEGPDGGGKSTAALAVAKAYDAEVIHHGPYSGQTNIVHHYIDSMSMAVQGQRNVVLDRSWLSEPIYGTVFRDGLNRISTGQSHELRSYARICRGIIVLCLPPLKVCLMNYRKRKEVEYLNNEEQLKAVWEMYCLLSPPTGIPMIRYNYVMTDISDLIHRVGYIVASQSSYHKESQ